MLNDTTMAPFVAQARRYVGRYRGRRPSSRTSTSARCRESISRRRTTSCTSSTATTKTSSSGNPGDALATLLLSADDWDPYLVSLESLMCSEILPPEDRNNGGLKREWGALYQPTAEDLELSRTEVMRVTSCFLSIRQAEAEPDLLQRSILTLREDDELPAEMVVELAPLESEPRIVRQVNKLGGGTLATIDDIEPEAFRLATHYFIDRVHIGGPSLPLDEQI
ncbi:hypothetical protein [Streptomyces niveus]|uniref:hypothetical protein n=1 Tax=Streptomyces niveus TaxID=193462 RepID=UPI003442D817